MGLLRTTELRKGASLITATHLGLKPVPGSAPGALSDLAHRHDSTRGQQGRDARLREAQQPVQQHTAEPWQARTMPEGQVVACPTGDHHSALKMNGVPLHGEPQKPHVQ